MWWDRLYITMSSFLFRLLLFLHLPPLKGGSSVAVTHRGFRTVWKRNGVVAWRRLITYAVPNLIKLTENANCIVILCNELDTTTNLFRGLSWLFTNSIGSAAKKVIFTMHSRVHTVVRNSSQLQTRVVMGTLIKRLKSLRLLAGYNIMLVESRLYEYSIYKYLKFVWTAVFIVGLEESSGYLRNVRYFNDNFVCYIRE
jgi:hypothetical protein